MKLIIWIVIISIAICSCSRSPVKQLRAKIEESDRGEIVFYGKERNSLTKKDLIIPLNGRDEMEKILKYISDETTIQITCPLEGTIRYFNKNVLVQEIGFAIQPDCVHIEFSINDKLYSKELTKEGVDYLTKVNNNLTSN
jgi:hypothetical protein